MKRLTIFFVMLSLALSLPAFAKDKKTKGHLKVPEYQECSECHAGEKALWESGKHGLMNVKCVVCHGSTDENFYPKPDINRCVGCHAEKVADVKRMLLPKERRCTLCHTLHSVKSKFHSEGGN